MNKKKIENSNFYSGLFRKFDKALITQIDRLSRTLNLAIDKVDKRLKSCEETMVYFIDCTNQKCETDLALAEVLVNKELRSKIVMSQWTNKFLATTNAEHLDPISFAFSRFSLNIALSFKEVDPRYLVKYKLHKHLVDYISQDSELVVGPALMALVHLSLFNELKGEIVAVGALPMLLKIMANSKSKTILTQAAKLCSSLALHRPNKTLMANSGCFHTLIDLILGAHTAINNHIQFFALSSVVNIVHNSDSNRMLAVELSAIKPTVTVLQTTTKEEILLEAVKVIANISYANGYCANCVLVAGGGEVMLEVLESGDVLKQPRIAHAILAAFSNICSTEVNQSHVGSIKGLVDCVIRICDYAK